MNGNQLRAFVALIPDDASRDALHALPVAHGARRTSIAQLHMTLAFLGAVDRDKCDLLAARFAGLTVTLPSQHVERLAWWPSMPRARLIVAELAAEPMLASLNDMLVRMLVDIGLPVDRRPFRPHVTLARLPRDAVGQPAQGGALHAPVALRFDMLTLFESLLSHRGAQHRPIASVPVAVSDDAATRVAAPR